MRPYPRTISSPACADPPVRPPGKAHRPHGAIERVTHPEAYPREFRSGSPRPSPRRVPALPTRHRARPQTTWQPHGWEACGLLTRKVRDSPGHKPGGLLRTAGVRTRRGPAGRIEGSRGRRHRSPDRHVSSMATGRRDSGEAAFLLAMRTPEETARLKAQRRMAEARRKRQKQARHRRTRQPRRVSVWQVLGDDPKRAH